MSNRVPQCLHAASRTVAHSRDAHQRWCSSHLSGPGWLGRFGCQFRTAATRSCKWPGPLKSPITRFVMPPRGGTGGGVRRVGRVLDRCLDLCLCLWPWRLGRDRRLALDCSVWALGVVLVDVDAQDALELRWPRISSQSGHSVRAVRTKRSACALACGERNGVPTTVTPSVRRTSSRPVTNFAWRSRIRNLTSSSAPERLRLRACWVTQWPSGLVVVPARWTRRV